MIKSKLIRLWQSLDNAELRAFKKWIDSPVHNQHKDVQKIFQFIYSRSTISNVTMKKERAFKYIYPNETLDIKRLRHVMSFATDVLEDFIRNNEQVLDSKKNNLALFKAFRKRNLKKDAQKQEQVIRKLSQKSSCRDADFYLLQYHLEQEAFELSSLRDRPTSTNLQQLLDNNSYFFIINTLRYACTSITHQNLFKTETAYEIPFLDYILGKLADGHYQEVRTIQLYYACYLALTIPEEEQHFVQMKSLIQNHPQLLSHHEFRDVYNLAINYCIKKLNTGNKQYIKEAYLLYTNGLETKILLDDEGYFSRFAFKNMVALGLNLAYFDEINTLLKRGKKILHPDFATNYVDYNTAKYHFAQQEYTQCNRILIQTDFDDLFMNLDAKMMLLKIYVEQEEYDLLEHFLHSFSQYLRRKSVMSYHKSNYNNIIRITRKILYAFTPKEKEKIKADIENTSPLTERQWLLDLIS